MNPNLRDPFENEKIRAARLASEDPRYNPDSLESPTYGIWTTYVSGICHGLRHFRLAPQPTMRQTQLVEGARRVAQAYEKWVNERRGDGRLESYSVTPDFVIWYEETSRDADRKLGFHRRKPIVIIENKRAASTIIQADMILFQDDHLNQIRDQAKFALELTRNWPAGQRFVYIILAAGIFWRYTRIDPDAISPYNPSRAQRAKGADSDALFWSEWQTVGMPRSNIELAGLLHT